MFKRAFSDNVTETSTFRINVGSLSPLEFHPSQFEALFFFTNLTKAWEFVEKGG